jgi:hypothetical protein
MTFEDFAGTNDKIAALNAQADTALSDGDRPAYDALVDQMIDLENAHLDAGGELPPPAYKC